MPSVLGVEAIVLAPPTPPTLRISPPTVSPAAYVVPVAGPPGAPGAAGAAGARPPLAYEFLTPAATWTLTHDRGGRPEPAVFTTEDGDQRVYTDLSYPSPGVVVVTWPSPETGLAFIQ